LIFDENGQCYGKQLPDGRWICDDPACEGEDIALTAHLNALKGETAEWIDGLQDEDMRQDARLLAEQVTELGERLRDVEVNKLAIGPLFGERVSKDENEQHNLKEEDQA